MADTRRLPRPVAAVWNWQILGACRGMDSDVFFHPDRERGTERAAREARAKQVCQVCPVVAECRRHALTVQEPYGVWGGLTVGERADLLHGPDRAPARRGLARLTLVDRPARHQGPDGPS